MYRPLGSASLACLAILMLAGCETPLKMPGMTEPTPQRPRAGATTEGLGREDPGRLQPWEDPASPIYRRIIYFGYDRTDILPEYVPLLRTHADFLAKHPNVQVTIEGHTDERGTREYNLALGDQRAAAVRRFLAAEGVAQRQLGTLSYGEEKPASPGHGESSWSLNRRAELDYQGR